MTYLLEVLGATFLATTFLAAGFFSSGVAGKIFVGSGFFVNNAASLLNIFIPLFIGFLIEFVKNLFKDVVYFVEPCINVCFFYILIGKQNF